ncbi:MAG: thiolase family protein [Desulfobacterales bacterium]|nr:thiolase family protein [Desulfobacterales bacterium]
MREVAVIGVGMIKMGKFPERMLSSLGREAVLAAMKDAGVERSEIQAGYSATLHGGSLLGQRIFKDLGMTGMPILNMENACSGGSSALREGWLGIASGLYDMVIVVGSEKLSALGGGTIPLEKEDLEASQGMVMPALYAMRARRYMANYGASKEHLAKVVVKSRKNASKNPYAQFTQETTVEEVLNSRMIADPITLFQCCPTGDGAGAAVLCSMDKAKKYTTQPIRIRASILVSGKFEPGFRDMTTPEITFRASKMAYEMAGIGPEDVNVAEVHDAFSIAELLYYEALRFCGRGEAIKLIDEGTTNIDGRIAVNPSGGLISKGHPVGATGLAQVAEIVWQLRGRAGARQVKNAKVGLTHCTGGGIYGLDHGACSIHILTK